MAKGEDSHSEMANVRQRDGINVIFDQNSPASSRSRSPARSSGGGRRSVGSGRHRGRGTHGRRYRSSSSSSSSSRSSSHTRSRSHPRCHRPSSRCRCDKHRRNGRERRSRHSSRRYRRSVSRFSQSPPRTHKSGSRSGSSEHSVNLNLDDKEELIKTAKSNATTILGVEKLELPERILEVEKLELSDCVKPILSEQSVEFKWVSSDTWVRQDPEKTLSQSIEGESDRSSPTMSPKMKISFSIHNSVVKQTVAASSCAKVTSRMDIYESRKPYGHWVPVQSDKTSKARKHRPATSH